MSLLTIIVVALVLIIGALVVLNLLDKRRKNNREERKVEKTLHPTKRFTRKHVVVEWPDGETERITYDDRDDSDHRVDLKTYDSDAFNVGRRLRSGEPKVNTYVPEANKRTLSLHNVRSIDVERTEEYVAVFEIDATVKQHESPTGSWYTDHINFDHSKSYDADIWLGVEWDAYDPEEDEQT